MLWLKPLEEDSFFTRNGYSLGVRIVLCVRDCWAPNERCGQPMANWLALPTSAFALVWEEALRADHLRTLRTLPRVCRAWRARLRASPTA